MTHRGSTGGAGRSDRASMGMSGDRWKEITPAGSAWEREALAFLRAGLPDHEPHRAWTNFEFIGDDGPINEVDALVLTPKGFSLVEVKSRPGVESGGAGTWSWTDGAARDRVPAT